MRSHRCLISRHFHFRTAHSLYSFPRTVVPTAIHTLEDSLADWLSKVLSPQPSCSVWSPCTGGDGSWSSSSRSGTDSGGTTAARRCLGRHCEHTNHSQREDVHHRCDGEEVRCLDELSQTTCRTRMLSSVASQTFVAPQAPAVGVAVDRQGPKAGGEHETLWIEGEMQLWVPLTTCRSRQAAAASRNRVTAASSSTSLGLET